MIMKDMIEDDFTPNTGICVNVEVFPADQIASGGLNVILLAAATGKAPDVWKFIFSNDRSSCSEQ